MTQDSLFKCLVHLNCLTTAYILAYIQVWGFSVRTDIWEDKHCSISTDICQTYTLHEILGHCNPLLGKMEVFSEFVHFYKKKSAIFSVHLRNEVAHLGKWSNTILSKLLKLSKPLDKSGEHQKPRLQYISGPCQDHRLV